MISSSDRHRGPSLDFGSALGRRPLAKENRNMRVTIALAAVTAVMLFVPAAAPASELKLETDEQKTIFALGMMISRNLGPFNLSADEIDLVAAGLKASLTGGDTLGIDIAEYQPKVQMLAHDRAQAVAEVEKEKANAFLEAEAAKEGAVKTDSGLIYTVLKEGNGPTPAATDKVTVHYHGTLSNGEVFDSSVDRGQPATFPLDGVIKCWTEGVQKMKQGGKARLVCPSDIAYGDRGAGPKIKPGAALVFEVELLEIVAD